MSSITSQSFKAVDMINNFLLLKNYCKNISTRLYANLHNRTWTPEEEKKWLSPITRSTAHFTSGLLSDLVICKHWIEYGHTWLWMLLLRPGTKHSTQTHKPKWEGNQCHVLCYYHKQEGQTKLCLDHSDEENWKKEIKIPPELFAYSPDNEFNLL